MTKGKTLKGKMLEDACFRSRHAHNRRVAEGGDEAGRTHLRPCIRPCLYKEKIKAEGKSQYAAIDQENPTAGKSSGIKQALQRLKSGKGMTSHRSPGP